MDDERSVFPGFDRMADDADALIEQLAQLRRQRRLSQTEVAARMGTSQSALARLESGQSDLRMSTVARYASALGADVGFALRPRPRPADQARPADKARPTDKDGSDDVH